MSGNHAVISNFSVAATGGLESRAWAPGPELPYLPLSTPSAAFPSTSGYTITSVGAGNLQSALNAASCNPHGTILELPVADVETGSFTLPNLACASGQWIILTTAGVVEGTITDLNGAADFPARGTRLDPSLWTGRIARITTSTGANAISCPNNTPCNHIWIVGVEIEEANPSGFGEEGFSVGLGATLPSNLPSFITLDRDYIHGKAGNLHLRRCVDLNGSNLIVVDNYISECHETGEDSQDIGTYASSAVLLQNNFLEATSEKFLVGGSNIPVNQPPYDMQVTDYTIQHNFFYKTPGWFTSSSEYIGPPVQDVKNLYEMKGGVRFLVQDNVVENNWVAGQGGECILMQPVMQSGPHVIQLDTTIRDNLCEHASQFLDLAGRDPTLTPADPALRTDRVYIHDNLAEDINGNTWGYYTFSMEMSTGPRDAVWDHNTVLPVLDIGEGLYAQINYFPANFYFTNMIFAKSIYGGIMTDGTTEGTASINKSLVGPPPGALTNDVLVGDNCSLYPSTWSCPAAWTDVGFVNYDGGNGGDYRLCTGVNTPASGCAAASPYAAGQPNGCQLNPVGSLDPGPAADCGANVAQIESDIAGVAIFPADAPTLTSLSTSSMVCNGTNTLTITGTNLAEQGTEVLVNNVVVAQSGVTSTSITIAPPDATGVTVPVTVDNFGLPVSASLACQ